MFTAEQTEEGFTSCVCICNMLVSMTAFSPHKTKQNICSDGVEFVKGEQLGKTMVQIASGALMCVRSEIPARLKRHLWCLIWRPKITLICLKSHKNQCFTLIYTRLRKTKRVMPHSKCLPVDCYYFCQSYQSYQTVSRCSRQMFWLKGPD